MSDLLLTVQSERLSPLYIDLIIPSSQQIRNSPQRKTQLKQEHENRILDLEEVVRRQQAKLAKI